MEGKDFKGVPFKLEDQFWQGIISRSDTRSCIEIQGVLFWMDVPYQLEISFEIKMNKVLGQHSLKPELYQIPFQTPKEVSGGILGQRHPCRKLCPYDVVI